MIFLNLKTNFQLATLPSPLDLTHRTHRAHFVCVMSLSLFDVLRWYAGMMGWDSLSPPHTPEKKSGTFFAYFAQRTKFQETMFSKTNFRHFWIARKWTYLVIANFRYCCATKQQSLRWEVSVLRIWENTYVHFPKKNGIFSKSLNIEYNTALHIKTLKQQTLTLQQFVQWFWNFFHSFQQKNCNTLATSVPLPCCHIKNHKTIFSCSVWVLTQIPALH